MPKLVVISVRLKEAIRVNNLCLLRPYLTQKKHFVNRRPRNDELVPLVSAPQLTGVFDSARLADSNDVIKCLLQNKPKQSIQNGL